jgi:hypothetical protein
MAYLTDDFVQMEWLGKNPDIFFDQVAGAERLGCISGYQQDRQQRLAVACGARKLQPVDAGHADIRKKQIVVVLFYIAAGGIAITYGNNIVARAGQCDREELPHRLIVFGNKNTRHSKNTLTNYFPHNGKARRHLVRTHYARQPIAKR